MKKSKIKTSNIIIIIFIVLIILVGVYLFIQYNKPDLNEFENNPSNSDNSTTENSDNVINPAPATKKVTIIDFAFMPKVLTIKPGDTVIWTNSDTFLHTVTSDSGTELNSKTLEVGQTYSYTFDTAGNFSYHCSIYPKIKAKIIVK